MGLAKTVAVRFPEWGPDFATLMVSMAAMLPVLQLNVYKTFDFCKCIRSHCHTTCRLTCNLPQCQPDVTPGPT